MRIYKRSVALYFMAAAWPVATLLLLTAKKPEHVLVEIACFLLVSLLNAFIVGVREGAVRHAGRAVPHDSLPKDGTYKLLWDSGEPVAVPGRTDRRFLVLLKPLHSGAPPVLCHIPKGDLLIQVGDTGRLAFGKFGDMVGGREDPCSWQLTYLY